MRSPKEIFEIMLANYDEYVEKNMKMKKRIIGLCGFCRELRLNNKITYDEYVWFSDYWKTVAQKRTRFYDYTNKRTVEKNKFAWLPHNPVPRKRWLRTQIKKRKK